MLQVTLLGEQMLTGPDGAVRPRSSRTLELIAFLVVHSNSPQPRQRIAALFWPDSSDEQALTNLRRELHHLRAVLGDDKSLEVTSRDLCWRDATDCVVDVRTFGVERAAALATADRAEFLRHAGEAVRNYGGEFLPGSHDDWALDTRNALEQQCVDLLDRMVDQQRAEGELTAAVALAKRRIQLRPLEEIGYRTLMQVQGDLGDRAGAVSTYHHCASVLERELGVEPDPLTRKTLNKLLARTGPAVNVPQPTERPGRGGSRLIGRTTEFSTLLDLWRSASDGRPGLALIRGDAGVGKSRLMTELADTAARAGAVVASAQCFGAAGRLALSPVADWLRTPAVRAGLTGLDAIWRTEVDRLAPTTKTRGDPGPGPRAMVDAWQRHRFFEGLTRALLAVGKPVLLTLDNLHWADPETLAFITFSLGLNPRAPIMVVGTMREEFADHEPGLDQWIGQMRTTGLLSAVSLSPFDAADTATLVESVTGHAPSPDAATLLQATTGGFPLYIVEASRCSDGEVPVGELSTVLSGRLDQVSEPAQQVAELAAAVGRDFSLDLLTEAADLDADGVVRAVDELWRRRILHECGENYDFSHDLLRDAAYDRVSRPRRWLLHRRIAQGLELLHPDSDAVSAQLAEQYARGGRGERAVDYYRRAAEVAAGRYAHSEAIRLHDAALAIVREMPEGLDRVRKELELLEAMAGPLNATLGYSAPRVRETLKQAVALAETLGRPDSVLDALIGLWASQFVHGDSANAHSTATRVVSLVTPSSRYRGPAHFAFGGSAVSLGRPAQALRHFALGAEYGGTHALSVGTRPDVHGRAWSAHAHWLLGQDDEAAAACSAAIALARTAQDNPYALAVALSYGAITQQLRQDLATLTPILIELRDLCDRYEFAYYREWVVILDGWTQGGETGLAAAKRGVDSLTAAGSFARMPYWLSLLAELQQPDAARATLDAAIATGRAHDDVWWLPEVMRRRAAYDSEPGAVQRLRTAAELAASHGSVALVRRCAGDLAAFGVRDLDFSQER